jgi:hypothetical protein
MNEPPSDPAAICCLFMSRHGRDDPQRTSDPIDPEGPSDRERRLARWGLVVVVAGSLVVQLALIQADRPPSWDESIYISQVTPEMHAMFLRAFRARGITYLIAPVTLAGGSVEQVRLFLMVLSSLVVGVTFAVTIPLIGLAAPIAAAFFTSSWLFVFNGSAVLPNLWAAILGLAMTALIARRLEGGGTRHVVLAAASLAGMAVVRPTEAVVVFGAIGLYLLLSRRASWRLVPMLGVALFLGLLPWFVEVSLRFGGPIRGLGVAHTEQHLGFADAGANLSAYLAATDGRPLPDIPPAGVLWWSSLLVLTVVAIARSSGSRRSIVLLCGAGALVLAAEYLVFVSAVAPRFLLPAYAFIAIPVAVGLHSLLRGGILARSAGALVLVLVGPWIVWQAGVAERVGDEQREELVNFRDVGLRLREMADGRPCAFMSPHGWPSIEFAAGCRGSALARPRGPSERELERLSAGGRRGFVILRVPPRPRSSLARINPVRFEGSSQSRRWIWFIYEIPVLDD